jgi:hypothetical protein
VVNGNANNTYCGVWDGLSWTSPPNACDSGCYSFIGNGFQNSASGKYSSVLNGFCNTASGAYSIVNGCCSNDNGNNFAYVFGEGISADRVKTMFVNNLSIKTIPTSSAGLPSGSVWSNSGVLNIVP